MRKFGLLLVLGLFSINTVNAAIVGNISFKKRTTIAIKNGGTFVVPSNITTIEAIGSGGGGGGGGGNGSCGGGCAIDPTNYGGAAIGSRLIIPVVPGHTLTIAVGSGGAGGSNPGAGTGGNGGATSITDTTTSTVLANWAGGTGGVGCSINPCNATASIGGCSKLGVLGSGTGSTQDCASPQFSVTSASLTKNLMNYHYTLFGGEGGGGGTCAIAGASASAANPFSDGNNGGNCSGSGSGTSGGAGSGGGGFLFISY